MIDQNRKVGSESNRDYKERCSNGFFDKYMSGEVIEIGNKGYDNTIEGIVPWAKTFNLGDEGYNGYEIPLPDNSVDCIYSSHVLEHIPDYKRAFQAWHKVCKINGYIILTVPHQYLYERKKELPSKLNGDHKRFYTPASLLKEIEESLDPNTYRIRLLQDKDKGYNYSIGLDKHPHGPYEIEVIIQKIQKPEWDLV